MGPLSLSQKVCMAFNALQPETSRSTPVGEQVGFSVHSRVREGTPWGSHGVGQYANVIQGIIWRSCCGSAVNKPD